MPRKSKNRFEVNGDTITIMRDGWDELAFATYREDYFDAEASQLRERLAVSLFKDFSTGCYQITIGCNDTIVRTDANGSKHYINEIKLLYNEDYPIVILDAEAILTEYESSGRISLSHLRHCDVREHEATILELTEEEKNRAFVFRDGAPYLVIGNGTSLIHTVHYDEGWSPPDGAAE